MIDDNVFVICLTIIGLAVFWTIVKLAETDAKHGNR
jgi:hypothetical protein